MPDYSSRRYHIARQIKINELIDKGVWDDRKHFKQWLFITFGKRTTKAEAWKPKELRAFWIYLKWLNGEMEKKPSFTVSAPWRITDRQKWRIDELRKTLGWDDNQVAGFIKRQLGVYSFPAALSKKAATKVITGLEKTRKYNQNKEQ